MAQRTIQECFTVAKDKSTCGVGQELTIAWKASDPDELQFPFFEDQELQEKKRVEKRDRPYETLKDMVCTLCRGAFEAGKPFVPCDLTRCGKLLCRMCSKMDPSVPPNTPVESRVV